MQPAIASAPTVRSRFHDVCAGRQPSDRLPMLEWATWWDRTVQRWRGEGLDPALDGMGMKRHLGLDVDYQLWVWQLPGDLPLQPGVSEGHGGGRILDAAGYEAIRDRIYPTTNPCADYLAEWRRRGDEQQRGEALVWMTLNGFFWWPRTLLGIERHLYAFGDQPGLLERINQDQATWMLGCIDRLCSVVTPDFMTFAEDMSYNHGPMLSKRAFDRFLAPFYRQVIPELKRRGIRVFVDSDGDVTKLVPWLEEVGFEGLLPIERQAGCDIDRLQADHPEFCFLGHFDKMAMPLGEAAMRAEFERLLPAMRRGRFLPSVDHQTPPGVSLEQYRTYLRLFREYAERACRSRARP